VPRTVYKSGVPKKPESSRVPSAVGAIPVVGDLMKSAESQARWMQEMLEQNARLIGQFPETMKTFNDSIERFNQTIGRLDRAVTRIEVASKNLTGPVEKMVADTQRQVAVLQATIDRILAVLAELPGAGVLRRLAASDSSSRPQPRRAR
jgi:septal ring factor EnvC (AmiA/AmiB activator)